MSATEKVARILALLPWLIERPGASVSETAEAFGVGTATILDDLDTIGYCGLPGLGGGDLFEISIIDGRILVEIAHELRRPLRLTPAEGIRLLLAGQAVGAALGGELDDLEEALDRVRDALGISTGVEVRLIDDGAAWLTPLRTAIDERRRVRLHYRGRADDELTERTVEPRRFEISAGHWYLLALDVNLDDHRIFRLDRIGEVNVLDERAEWIEPAPDVIPSYEPGDDDVEVVLLLDRDARWVAEQFVVDRVEELDDGGRLVALRTDALRWVRDLVLSAAPHVTVREPEVLRREVREAAGAALERYEPR